MQEIQFNIKSVKNLFNDIKKFDENKDIKENSNLKINFNSKIEFKNLSFAYELPDQNKNKIFENINLEIKKGDYVGIKGESGSGKSTLIDLLIGLQNCNHGNIFVDGVDINENIKSWQKLIGCVPQEVFISDSSLKKNIAFGELNENISDERVKKSIKFSNLELLTSKLESGIDTIIGEKDQDSSRSKQRIGIAIAIYNNPEILIVDEATISLDRETEQKIIGEIKTFKKKKTVIIISHRKEIFKDCDYIFEISNKKIIKTVAKI